MCGLCFFFFFAMLLFLSVCTALSVISSGYETINKVALACISLLRLSTWACGRDGSSLKTHRPEYTVTSCKLELSISDTK